MTVSEGMPPIFFRLLIFRCHGWFQQIKPLEKKSKTKKEKKLNNLVSFGMQTCPLKLSEQYRLYNHCY